MAVLLETTLGDVVIDLYTEERPRACLNFLKLCKIKYYNYCLIHNVQRDFIIQTGDPTGTGRGGESVFGQLYGDQASFFEAEKVPRIKHKKKGTVSMVNNGSDQHGSQFLITTGDNLDYLDGVHTVFGEVTEGMDIIKKINETFVDKDFVPYQDIRINHTVILDDPFDDPPDLLIPDRSPEPTREQLDSGRIGADEEIDDFKGRSAEEVEEIKAEKEAKTQAILLEMVGDLPDADIKPPENVLFVCKLNPVTTDEDLEIIFSRFGPIRSCEVIRDWKTGESLCYAFIEFEKEEDCEKAFFKMDNVLIDDRRIHVDFSQSVAKVKWKGKGGKYTKSDFKEYEKEQDKPSNLVLKDKVKPKQEYPSQEPVNQYVLTVHSGEYCVIERVTKAVEDKVKVNTYSQMICSCYSAKYDLVLEDQAEDSKSSHSHTSKKHKKKTHHCSEEKEDEDYMPIKNTNQDIYREMGFGHYEEEESCWEKQKSEKRDRPQNRSRSRSRERDGHYSNSHKSKYQTDPYERERSKKRDRSRSPKKSKDKEKSKYR
ncbi:Peptidyl-prolyl cis-trans isomerase-like 4 [Camelus dromedarius]|uniref:Peptidyl-prolyl cis-trans isomerase n=2 Tax=Laurasiatheria TaxID=314145 RepID=A0A5N4DWJ7_CAMDR|nr:Peptidyl-prolyl cis-trans isomerase-like 4 [Camelus dromedarius]